MWRMFSFANVCCFANQIIYLKIWIRVGTCSSKVSAGMVEQPQVRRFSPMFMERLRVFVCLFNCYYKLILLYVFDFVISRILTGFCVEIIRKWSIWWMDDRKLTRDK